MVAGSITFAPLPPDRVWPTNTPPVPIAVTVSTVPLIEPVKLFKAMVLVVALLMAIDDAVDEPPTVAAPAAAKVIAPVALLVYAYWPTVTAVDPEFFTKKSPELNSVTGIPAGTTEPLSARNAVIRACW